VEKSGVLEHKSCSVSEMRENREKVTMDGRTDGQTDGRTTCNRNTALCTEVHRAVKTNAVCSAALTAAFFPQRRHNPAEFSPHYRLSL